MALVAAMRLPALTEEAKLYQAVAPLREASFDTLRHLVHVRHMTARSVVMKLGSLVDALQASVPWSCGTCVASAAKRGRCDAEKAL